MLVDLLDLLVELVSLEVEIHQHNPRAVGRIERGYHGGGHAEEPRGWRLEKTVGRLGMERRAAVTACYQLLHYFPEVSFFGSHPCLA